MKKFEYSRTEYEKICEECMLDDDEKIILKLRCQNKSRIEILTILENMNIPMSDSTLGRKILKIDNKIRKMIRDGF